MGASTLLALLFIHNQNKIYLLSYELEKKNHSYEDLLDENKILLYDINKLSSVPQISYKFGILFKDEFTIPKRIVRLERIERRENFFTNLFRSKALAKEIKFRSLKK
jgi:hypothetical protein